jgi:hypothetical protein
VAEAAAPGRYRVLSGFLWIVGGRLLAAFTLRAVQPARASWETSSSFCGVPSGLEVSHSTSPS